MSIENRVKELVGEGKTLALVRATLLVEGYKSKEIAAATKGIAANKAGDGFNERFFDYLAEERRSDAEIRAFCEEYGSENTIRQFSWYARIGKLSQKVWDAK